MQCSPSPARCLPLPLRGRGSRASWASWRAGRSRPGCWGWVNECFGYAQGVDLPDRISIYLTERPNGCWSWHRAHSAGYACVWWEGSQRSLHRVLYGLFRGTPPPDMVLDHVVCGDKSCPNPWHVEPETNERNLTRERRERETCKHGHSDWSTRPNGSRRCNECARIEARNRQRRQRGIPQDWPRYKHFNSRGGDARRSDTSPE